jgi:hypothetical protein
MAEIRCARSRKKTFAHERKSPKPVIKIKYRNITIINHGNANITLGFAITNRGTRKIRPTKKFNKFAKVEETGINSLGNTPCFKMLDFATNEFVASIKALLKNNQGRIPASTNRA